MKICYQICGLNEWHRGWACLYYEPGKCSLPCPAQCHLLKVERSHMRCSRMEAEGDRRLEGLRSVAALIHKDPHQGHWWA